MYCTYLTIYSGDKLPQFYIGSTSIKKYKEGYCGSVKSKKYKKIWEQELKENTNLFDTIILSEHNTREEALIEENKIQYELDVVKSPNFINQSFANVNGFFGMDVKGKNNPMHGRSPFNKGKSLSEEHKSKMSESRKGNINGKGNKGKLHQKVICPHCEKEGGVTNMKRYHFNNCKKKNE